MDLEVHGWPDGWELVSCGDGRKLERFGAVLLDRPAAQAIWPADPVAPWAAADAAFQRGEGGTGDWQTGPGAAPSTWEALWRGLRFELRLTGFGNVGLFPEHAAHWAWLEEMIGRRTAADGPGAAPVEVLNLFAYTGGASLAAARAGARVTHLDGARAVNTWAALNAERSGIPEGRLRCVTDDALGFVRREARRARRYDIIILDPPTFGRGARSEVWKIERDLHPLLIACRELLAETPLGVLLTAHSPGVTAAVLRALLAPFGGRVEAGEMLLCGTADAPPLPAGVYARWTP